MQKIILIDDSIEASQLCPRNTLLIKPFSDIYDKSDRELYDLTILLQALVHDNVEDFRDAIDDLGTHELGEAVTEYRMRVNEAKQKEHNKRNRGLGKLLRGEESTSSRMSDTFNSGHRSLLSEVTDDDGMYDNKLENRTGLMNTKSRVDLAGVGAGKLTGKGSGSKKPDEMKQTKKTGAITQWFRDRAAADEERANMKMQAVNEKYETLMKAKMEQDELAARKNHILNGDDD